jgi:arylsulfatase A-like enzyme
MDAHTPYARWDDHLEAVRGDTAVEHVVDPTDHVTVGDEPPQSVIDAYDAGIRSADEQVGRLLATVDSDATVVLTGDHGEEFGRHGEFHAASLHANFTQVPIVVRSPDIAVGRVGSHPVQHLDIPPTLLHATGDGVPDHYVGTPLQTVDRDGDWPVYFCLDDSTAVRVHDWKLIRKEVDGTTTLYYSPYGEGDTEWDGDPPMDESEFVELDAEQREWMGENGLFVATGELDENNEHLSEEVKDNLEELGYI